MLTTSIIAPIHFHHRHFIGAKFEIPFLILKYSGFVKNCEKKFLNLIFLILGVKPVRGFKCQTNCDEESTNNGSGLQIVDYDVDDDDANGCNEERDAIHCCSRCSFIAGMLIFRPNFYDLRLCILYIP